MQIRIFYFYHTLIICSRGAEDANFRVLSHKLHAFSNILPGQLGIVIIGIGQKPMYTHKVLSFTPTLFRPELSFTIP